MCITTTNLAYRTQNQIHSYSMRDIHNATTWLYHVTLNSLVVIEVSDIEPLISELWKHCKEIISKQRKDDSLAV